MRNRKRKLFERNALVTKLMCFKELEVHLPLQMMLKKLFLNKMEKRGDFNKCPLFNEEGIEIKKK